MSTFSAALRAFHSLADHPDTNSTRLRPTLHAEEHTELMRALATGHRESIARELADVVYIAFGTALVYDIDLDAAFAEVHRANMQKAREGVRREDGKIVKPEGFIPPDMSGALR